ncbi:MAG: hypothetical protein GY821_02935 [Gammaproteobacteria bacterium]|nr:hypothetical protein [Gammaproteobacteria bacterium]
MVEDEFENDNEQTYQKFLKDREEVEIVCCKIDLCNENSMGMLENHLSESNYTIAAMNITNVHEKSFIGSSKLQNSLAPLPIEDNATVLMSYLSDSPPPNFNPRERLNYSDYKILHNGNKQICSGRSNGTAKNISSTYSFASHSMRFRPYAYNDNELSESETENEAFLKKEEQEKPQEQNIIGEKTKCFCVVL